MLVGRAVYMSSATLAKVPPSVVGTHTPDMYADSSDAKNNATYALSRIVGGRSSLSGIGATDLSQPPAIASYDFPSCASSTPPDKFADIPWNGQSALIRMPCAPSSTASALTSPFAPDLAAT